jgi:hypothetical protein
MPHREVNGFARLPVQFLKVRQARAANIELTQSCLPIAKHAIPRIHSLSAAVQKSRTFQVRQKTVDRTHPQPGPFRHMLRREPVRRLAEN